MHLPDPDRRYAENPWEAADSGPVATRGAVPQHHGTGPRQEYLDAFDAPAGTGTPGDAPAGHRRPEGGPPRRHRSEGGPPGRAPRGSGNVREREREGEQPGPTGQYTRSEQSAETGGVPTVPAQRRPAGAPRGHRKPPPPRRGGRGWVRTLTGIAAAGVVTVLAVGITGELEEGAGGPGSARGGQQNGQPTGSAANGPDGADDLDGDAAERSGARDPMPMERRPDGTPEGPAVYEEVMDRVYDLDPELTGSGELVPVPGTDPGPEVDGATELRYRVDVEPGVGFEPGMFAEAVHRTLSDPRSWVGGGRYTFTRVSSGNHDFVVTLASPGTTAEWCAKSGLNTAIDNVSCDSANTERVMINGWRWAQGADTFGPDHIQDYRQMLINHEVGHRIGYGHAVCPAEGDLAPVMMQQTKFLTLNGVTCEANAWPHPEN